MGERGEKCDYCFMFVGCLFEGQVRNQEIAGGLPDEIFKRYLEEVARISDCRRPHLRDGAIIEAAKRRNVEPPV